MHPGRDGTYSGDAARARSGARRGLAVGSRAVSMNDVTRILSSVGSGATLLNFLALEGFARASTWP